MATQSSPTATTSTTKASDLTMSQADFESLLHRVHDQAKRTAQVDSMADNVVLAKLACYAIRELHAEKIVRSSPPMLSRSKLTMLQYPRTAIRAMSILEYAEQKRSTGGAMKQAKREMRNEDRERREAREAAEEVTLIDVAAEDKQNGEGKA